MIHVGNKIIGENQPCFVVAEIGINHNGDMDLAFDMIKAAKDAGVDAVKFQNYETEDFILDKELVYEYESENKKITETQYEMFKRHELSKDQLITLKSCCDDNGIIFFSTPTGLKGIKNLQDIGTPLLKNGSDFLVNLELIRQMAETGIPTVLSTGMATLSEIDDAVREFENAGGDKLILLHCVSSYPANAEDVHLRKIPSIKKAFGYPVGFSDHTKGVHAAVGAVCYGACFIEKHFTLDRSLPGPDHHFSSTPEEMAELVRGIRFIERSLGTSKIGPTPSEKYGRHNFRLSCVAKSDLEKGQILKREDITFSRPSGGLEPKLISLLVGKKINKSIRASDQITLDLIT